MKVVMRASLFLPIFICSFALISLLHWPGIAKPAQAATCASEGGVCASRTDCSDGGGSVISGTGCTSPQLCCNFPASGGGSGSGSGSGSGAAGNIIGLIKINVLDPGTVVRNLVIIAFFAAGLFFFVQVLIGGISWIGAGGDPKALDAARSRITNAVIGLVIVVAAFSITLIATYALGINIFQPGGVTLPP